MKIHIVQKGDTLFEIAKNYNVDYKDIVSLNPQLSSPDMIMPGMKIKIPSTLKQVTNKADKAVRTESMESTQKGAKTAERPIGKVEGDDQVEKKQLHVKVPDSYEPLYPVRPIAEMTPSMPKKEKMPERKAEQVYEGKEEKKVEVTEETMPQTPYRPMGESGCEVEKRMVHYCCGCGRPVNMPPQQWYPSPWHRRGTYFTENPFMPHRMNCMPTHGMNGGSNNRTDPNYAHHMNQDAPPYQMNQMQQGEMNHRNNYSY